MATKTRKTKKQPRLVPDYSVRPSGRATVAERYYEATRQQKYLAIAGKLRPSGR